MHTNKVKAKVDFKFCMGSIPAMLRATKPVLSERQYKELCTEVNKVDYNSGRCSRIPHSILHR